jgi:putative transcriptional regulator
MRWTSRARGWRTRRVSAPDDRSGPDGRAGRVTFQSIVAREINPLERWTIFLVEGMNALADAREGKRTLRTRRVEFKPPPEVTRDQLIRLRTRLRLSRGLFATFLRTNPRTLENWEQGRARPNAQAALLIALVNKFPDMVERLENV